MIIQNHSNY